MLSWMCRPDVVAGRPGRGTGRRRRWRPSRRCRRRPPRRSVAWSRAGPRRPRRRRRQPQRPRRRGRSAWAVRRATASRAPCRRPRRPGHRPGRPGRCPGRCARAGRGPRAAGRRPAGRREMRSETSSGIGPGSGASASRSRTRASRCASMCGLGALVLDLVTEPSVAAGAGRVDVGRGWRGEGRAQGCSRTRPPMWSFGQSVQWSYGQAGVCRSPRFRRPPVAVGFPGIQPLFGGVPEPVRPRCRADVPGQSCSTGRTPGRQAEVLRPGQRGPARSGT